MWKTLITLNTWVLPSVPSSSGTWSSPRWAAKSTELLCLLLRNFRHCQQSTKRKLLTSPSCTQMLSTHHISGTHTQKDSKLIEMVHHRCSRFVTKTPDKRQAGIQPSIITRSMTWVGSLCMNSEKKQQTGYALQIINNLDKIQTPYHPALSCLQPKRGNQHQY